MKILLAGEYSRLHNTLKEGLEKLGHQARIVSAGDDFKAYPSDFSIRPLKYERFPWRTLRKAVHKFTGRDMAVKDKTRRLERLIPELKGYDVVQLINTYPFETPLPREKEFLRRLFDQNDKAFLLACGDDLVTNTCYLEGAMRYSVLTPLMENPFLKDKFQYSLKYLTPPFRDLHHFVMDRVRAVIPTDLDYAIPYRDHPKNAGMIPNPVNVDRLRYEFPPPGGKIVIFHGINTGNYDKKGNFYFENALKFIRRKFKDKVEIIETRDLPYDRYMSLIRKAHIVLDQVYSYDQGYNALESMAMGKVVFTGAEKEFYDHYGLQEEVCINALPDIMYLKEQLEALIEDPVRMQRISENARRFVEREHHYIDIARRYLDTWIRY
ncbi:MAG: glycosyltransferase [Chlorobi bacterium]|nr:glycosyltransferase [Chlorobiota bacterium]